MLTLNPMLEKIVNHRSLRHLGDVLVPSGHPCLPVEWVVALGLDRVLIFIVLGRLGGVEIRARVERPDLFPATIVRTGLEACKGAFRGGYRETDKYGKGNNCHSDTFADSYERH